MSFVDNIAEYHDGWWPIISELNDSYNYKDTLWS